MIRSRIVLSLALYGLFSVCGGIVTSADAQDRYSRQRATLRQFVGQDVLVIDSTSGGSQFHHADASRAFRLTLDAVQRDYIMVSRNVEGDKRDFVYPLGTIRRIRTVSNGLPLRPIVIELY